MWFVLQFPIIFFRGFHEFSAKIRNCVRLNAFPTNCWGGFAHLRFANQLLVIDLMIRMMTTIKWMWQLLHLLRYQRYAAFLRHGNHFYTTSVPLSYLEFSFHLISSHFFVFVRIIFKNKHCTSLGECTPMLWKPVQLLSIWKYVNRVLFISGNLNIVSI